MAEIGLGCMRLSTAPQRDDERAISVIVAALEAGVRLLDTADAYARDEADQGHNERLVAEALRRFGRRDGVTVVTKGGLRRPRGAWVPDGRARALRQACEASLSRLGRIDLYLLHAPDPRVPLATSARALRALHDDKLVAAVGLSNVNATQLEEVLAENVEVAAVEVELGPGRDEALLGGLLDGCRRHGIRLLAHRPLGGAERAERLGRHGVLQRVAERHAASAHEIALAWIADLGAVPLAGATRIETARSLGRARAIVLKDDDRALLDEAFDPHRVASRPLTARRPLRPEGEVVLLMGMPGAGKTTTARSLEADGYARLNRDERGGRLRGLLGALDEGLAGGQRRWVLDNTYARRSERARVRELAWGHGAAVRCVWIDTPLAEAQINAAARLLDRYGELPDADALARLSKRDPQAFPPSAQFRFERELEPPSPDEGFATMRVPFARQPWPGDRGAVLFHLDALSPSNGLAAEEGPLLVFGWRPGPGSETAARLRDLERIHGRAIDAAICPHGDGPPRCWCRPPLPGLILTLIRRHDLDPRRSLLVGRSTADRLLAERFGMRFAPSTEP